MTEVVNPVVTLIQFISLLKTYLLHFCYIVIDPDPSLHICNWIKWTWRQPCRGIYSVCSVLQNARMEQNPTFAVFQTRNHSIQYIFTSLHKAMHTFWHFSLISLMINNDMPASSHTHLPKNVWFCFLYYDQIKGKDIVNVHLYHKVRYVYTFLKTSPVFPLYRLPTVW